MILYLDTSALVKRYVEEPGSDLVDRLVGEATVVATSRVAYPEARAAFARRAREGAMTRAQLKRVVASLDSELDAWVWVELDAAIAKEAGRLAETRALRGFDAIHLGSALALRAGFDGRSVTFLAFDERLGRAALLEGLAAAPGAPRR